MITANAIITDIIVDSPRVWVQFEVDGKYFPAHYEFNTSFLSDITKLMFLLERTKSKKITDLIGKGIRVIDTEKSIDSVVAVGDNSKNKFVDLYGSEYPVRERKIYRKYKHK